jgi:hypothetical protein
MGGFVLLFRSEDIRESQNAKIEANSRLPSRKNCFAFNFASTDIWNQLFKKYWTSTTS